MDKQQTQPDAELSRLSPFELKGRIIAAADEKVKNAAYTLLNAGRGNPNWIATEARRAFFALGQFAMDECESHGMLPEGIAAIPVKEGISVRFEQWMRDHKTLAGVDFLRSAYEYSLVELAADADALVYEWTDGIIGDHYPTPPRILQYTEVITRKFLEWALCAGNPPQDTLDLFAVEGSTAGMCYCFDVLKHNFLLNKGDNIALMVPVFTPYIEIPELSEFDYTVLDVSADMMTPDGKHSWQYDPKDIEKLKDPKFKMLFVTNPSNPPSYELNKQTVEALKDVVKANPDLMILTDDVYGTFVRGYRSLIADMPYNTMSCYSFSKYYGATGWRLSVTALSRNNVFDKLLAALPQDKKEALNKRYESLTIDVPGLKFIDRMVAESRLIALNHTAGLSTPQQIQMSLMALGTLLDKEGAYHERMIKLIHDRYEALWDNFGFKMPDDPLRADYYSEIDLMVWAKELHGQEFADYINTHYNPLSAVFRLASETGAVVLNGDGFDGPKWSIRVSLANLNKADYVKIGKYIRQILEQYAS
ncbi:MAG: bifunctional aspartate transaminase/aspartate 4-decarboxylase [Muribaculaceae bacterium]|nr:bifunctional aspartate transaminase/aspartate 4-decarboxylase [Muribaculaceae bacterium]